MFNFRSRHCRGEDPSRRHVRGDFWPDGHRGRGFGHRAGGRLGRLFAHGDLHFVILHLIAEKPRHGYEVIKAIEDMVAGAYSPSPGTVYPALTMLEEQGYVAQEPGEGSKKLYAVTAEGQAYLDANRSAVAALLQRMEQTSAAQGGGPSPKIVRAVENLKLALRLKLERAPLSEAEIQAVTEALDRATGEIERS